MNLITKINKDIEEAEKNKDRYLGVYKEIKRLASKAHTESGAAHTQVYDSTVIRVVENYLANGGDEIAKKYLPDIPVVDIIVGNIDLELEVNSVDMKVSPQEVEVSNESVVSASEEERHFEDRTFPNPVEIPDLIAAPEPNLNDKEVVEETPTETIEVEPKKRGRKPKNAEQN